MEASNELPIAISQELGCNLAFPNSHHLTVTTAGGVYTWDADGATLLFRSGSQGIVAARKANNGSGILAVADGSVVVLHDTTKGMHKRSYKLRGSDVSPCSVSCWNTRY